MSKLFGSVVLADLTTAAFTAGVLMSWKRDIILQGKVLTAGENVESYIESNMTEVSLHSLALILCIVIGGCLAEVEVTESEDPMAKTFKSLREEEKNDFLAYFLALGIKDWAEDQPRLAKNFMYRGDFLVKQLHLSEDKIQQFENLNIPKDSRKKLLQWTKTEFNLTTKNILDLLRTDRCQGEKCVHFPDIGELCCPW